MLDREGVSEPGEIAIVGDEAIVERALRHPIEIGATEILALPFGQAVDQSRALALRGTLAR